MKWSFTIYNNGKDVKPLRIVPIRDPFLNKLFTSFENCIYFVSIITVILCQQLKLFEYIIALILYQNKTKIQSLLANWQWTLSLAIYTHTLYGKDV